MSAFISWILLIISVISGEEMLTVASGLFAIGAEISLLKNNGEQQ